ncbi:hypothetical protein B879_03989 [Cecembia lonarensis LW9]|uniref:Uncharacterized protein n=1 Tax=Cecembia lonarensis (strain CCUG 58316 / KCTC 22772 / LW9) TaxID=1225176 RepID=K1LAH9_CECL9|nr:hypothetical protein B879_03989 [Cecembia lonarensis LW9]
MVGVQTEYGRNTLGGSYYDFGINRCKYSRLGGGVERVQMFSVQRSGERLKVNS